MLGISKGHWAAAGTALAAYAIVYFVQKKVIAIPVVGPYLPGSPTPA